MKEIKTIGVLTSGGDAPGMNAAIRAVTRAAIYNGWKVMGVYRGYEGLINGDFKELTTESVSNTIQRGGTILKTARSEEFMTVEGRKKAYDNLVKFGVDALIVIGGNGSLAGAQDFAREYDIPIIGLPGTIDNDLYGTDSTIGYDTALNTIVECVDKIRDTATSHDRIFFVEVMGRDAGFLAQNSAIAAGAEAAKMADHAPELVGGHGCDLIDINFGCPVSKIAGRGAGSGMMKDPDKMVMITRRIVEAVGKPVTVKTRLGWDEGSKIIVELAERLQDTGVKALTIHGRTRCQMYKGEADWTLIGEVKRNPRMHIPIIGNGDINSPRKAKEAFDRYGVDGIMVARASFGHPWIFKEIKHFLATGEELPPLGVRERVELAKRQMRLSLDLKGVPTGVYEMRRHLSCYFKGLPDFKETRMRLVTENDPAEVFKILEYIAEKWGNTEISEANSVYGL